MLVSTSITASRCVNTMVMLFVVMVLFFGGKILQQQKRRRPIHYFVASKLKGHPSGAVLLAFSFFRELRCLSITVSHLQHSLAKDWLQFSNCKSHDCNWSFLFFSFLVASAFVASLCKRSANNYFNVSINFSCSAFLSAFKMFQIYAFKILRASSSSIIFFA